MQGTQDPRLLVNAAVPRVTESSLQDKLQMVEALAYELRGRAERLMDAVSGPMPALAGSATPDGPVYLHSRVDRVYSVLRDAVDLFDRVHRALEG